MSAVGRAASYRSLADDIVNGPSAVAGLAAIGLLMLPAFGPIAFALIVISFLGSRRPNGDTRHSGRVRSARAFTVLVLLIGVLFMLFLWPWRLEWSEEAGGTSVRGVAGQHGT